MSDLLKDNTIRDFLQDSVRQIKKASPFMSSTQLAKKLAIAIPTFNRIENGDTGKTNLNNAVKIIREAYPEANVKDIISQYYPELSDTYATTYSGNADAKMASSTAENYFQDVNTYEIMMLATSRHGTNRKFILEQFGKKGLASLDRMIADEVITSDSQGNFSLTSSLNASQDAVNNLFLNLLESNYNIESFGSHDNWNSLQYNSVNLKKVTPILREILIRANQEIRTTLNNPENDGHDVVWAGLVMDKLIRDSLNSGEN